MMQEADGELLIAQRISRNAKQQQQQHQRRRRRRRRRRSSSSSRCDGWGGVAGNSGSSRRAWDDGSYTS
jgi:hypothetical protein